MKAKNITLVGLLAIIVIVIVFVILLFPVLYNLVNDSKKELLVSESKRVYKEASMRYASGNTNKIVSSEDDTKLQSFKDNLKYCIIFNDNDYIVHFKVSDGNWIIDLDDDYSIDKVTIEDLKVGNLNNYECK